MGPSINFVAIFQMIYDGVFGGNWDTIETLWNVYSLVALMLSCVFFGGFIYAKIRFDELSALEREVISTNEKAWATEHNIHETHNTRWDAIQTRVTENSPESWRIAIIEADIMLDETLTNAGYVGQSIGEKLKSANTTSFTTLQDAWEAHKVRNEIAHVGSDFILTQRTAQETLVRFERVFREFGVI